MSVSSMAEKAYMNFAQAERDRETMRALLKISGKPVEKSPFTYGQLIFVVEKDAVTELMIYSYNDERIFARRLNGIRTSIPRDVKLFFSERDAYSSII